MDEMRYQIGDQVRIVDEANSERWDSDGVMESEWCRHVMTIREVCDDYYEMEEDDGVWSWYPEMIAELVSSNVITTPRQYKVGDSVQIVSQKCGSNWSDRMLNYWLGQVMTIREVCGTKYLMEEDRDEHLGNGWEWSTYMIAGLEDDFIFEPASADELANLLA